MDVTLRIAATKIRESSFCCYFVTFNYRAITNEKDFSELGSMIAGDLLPHLTRFYYYRAYIAR